MGVLSELVIAPADAGEDIRLADSPSSDWDGFSFKGMDNVKFATLLSLLSSGSASTEYERWLDRIVPVPGGGDDGPWVFVFTDEATKALSGVASKEASEFDSLVLAWAATDEFDGWSADEVSTLLRDAGNLADSAALEGMSLFLWVSL